MRRHGRLELTLARPGGSRSLIPAAWTDLEAPVEPARAGTLASLDVWVPKIRFCLQTGPLREGAHDFGTPQGSFTNTSSPHRR